MRLLIITMINCMAPPLSGGAPQARAQETGPANAPPAAPPVHGAQDRAPSGRLAQRLDIRNRLPSRSEETLRAGLQTPPHQARPDRNASAFILTAVEISGMTAFNPETIAPLYDGLLARAVTIDDISALVDAVTQAYRREGYFLSRATAPPQDMAGGVLRIHVAEGVIADIDIRGDAPARARRMLARLTTEKPARLKTVERALMLIGDLNGVRVVSSRLQPDLDDLARHTLVVELDLDPLDASLYTDNRGVNEAGPIQAYAQLAGNSLLLSGDRLSAGVFFIPAQPEELVLAEMGYRFPVGDAGTLISLSGDVSRFDAGAFLGALGVESRQQSLSVSLAHPFIRTRRASLWGGVGLEGRDIEEEQLDAPVFEDKFRIVYGALTFRSARANGVTTIVGRVSSGFDMLGASAGDGSLSRPDANGEFTKFNLEVSRYQNIGETFGVYAAFSGQTSLDPLLASEEFAIGGANFGRAYDYGEILGDDGLATQIELRFGRRPKTALLDFYQLYGFYDYGIVWNDNAAPGFASLSMASAGGGLRLRFAQSLSATFELARPLDRTPFTQNDRDWRGFFSVSREF